MGTRRRQYTAAILNQFAVSWPDTVARGLNYVGTRKSNYTDLTFFYSEIGVRWTSLSPKTPLNQPEWCSQHPQTNSNIPTPCNHDAPVTKLTTNPNKPETNSKFPTRKPYNQHRCIGRWFRGRIGQCICRRICASVRSCIGARGRTWRVGVSTPQTFSKPQSHMEW